MAQLLDFPVAHGISGAAQSSAETIVHVGHSGAALRLAGQAWNALQVLNGMTLRWCVRANPSNSIDGIASMAHKTSCDRRISYLPVSEPKTVVTWADWCAIITT